MPTTSHPIMAPHHADSRSTVEIVGGSRQPERHTSNRTGHPGLASVQGEGYQEEKRWSRGESNPRAGSTKRCKERGSTSAHNQGGAESGAVENHTAPADPDLAKVIEVWPTLPAAIKRAILAMIDASG